MKLHENIREVHSNIDSAPSDFKIRTTEKAFRILSSGLYSNKPQAIVRELSCNAYDAHVDAGNGDVPFHIHLPTRFEPWFEVRDYGTGLSDADIRELYTTYFDSSKTNSNLFTGALGLGSKSPFSYTDSFTIESRFDGTLNTYTAYLSSSGVPAIVLMDSESTDEPNGLNVRLEVKQSDFRMFYRAANKVVRFFPVQPTVNLKEEVVSNYYKDFATEITDGIYLVEDDLENYNFSSPVGVVQANVLYPVSINELFGSSHEFSRSALSESIRNKIDVDKSLGDRDIADAFQHFFFVLNKYVVLEVENGSCDVQPSREKLSYDSQTASTIREKLVDAYAAFHEYIRNYIDHTKSKYDKVVSFSRINDSLINADSNNVSIIDNLVDSDAKSLIYKIKVDDVAASNMRELSFERFTRKRIGVEPFASSSRSRMITPNLVKRLHIVLNDDCTSAWDTKIANIKKWMRSANIGRDESVLFVHSINELDAIGSPSRYTTYSNVKNEIKAIRKSKGASIGAISSKETYAVVYKSYLINQDGTYKKEGQIIKAPNWTSKEEAIRLFDEKGFDDKIPYVSSKLDTSILDRVHKVDRLDLLPSFLLVVKNIEKDRKRFLNESRFVPLEEYLREKIQVWLNIYTFTENKNHICRNLNKSLNISSVRMPAKNSASAAYKVLSVANIIDQKAGLNSGSLGSLPEHSKVKEVIEYLNDDYLRKEFKDKIESQIQNGDEWKDFVASLGVDWFPLLSSFRSLTYRESEKGVLENYMLQMDEYYSAMYPQEYEKFKTELDNLIDIID